MYFSTSDRRVVVEHKGVKKQRPIDKAKERIKAIISRVLRRKSTGILRGEKEKEVGAVLLTSGDNLSAVEDMNDLNQKKFKAQTVKS